MNDGNKSKTTYNQQYFPCPRGLIGYICSLGLSPTETKILACITELFGAWNYDKSYSVAVAISTSEFQKAIKLRSNRAVQDAIKSLCNKGFIEVQSKRGSKAKYKVIDTHLYPHKKQIKGG